MGGLASYRESPVIHMIRNPHVFTIYFLEVKSSTGGRVLLFREVISLTVVLCLVPGYSCR